MFNQVKRNIRGVAVIYDQDKTQSRYEGFSKLLLTIAVYNQAVDIAA